MIVPQDVADIPWHSPWVPVASPQLEGRLATEIGPGHVLSGRPVIAIGRRLDTDDDVLLAQWSRHVGGGPSYLQHPATGAGPSLSLHGSVPISL